MTSGRTQGRRKSDRARYLVLTSVLASVGVGLLSGCETVGFYQQAIAGQWQLIRQRQPLEQVLADPATPPQLLERLETAVEVLAFADEVLGFDPEGRYTGYVALEAPYVVWNLVVARPTEVAAQRWCFPVAGCVSYRGYFAQARAEAVAARYAARGYDVYVGGVAAYSTLGWFNDPLLSSFIHYPKPALAELLLHELAHGQLYVANATDFNESFATFVAREALAIWLMRPESQLSPNDLARHRARQIDAERFDGLLLQLRAALAEDFESAATDDEALVARDTRYAQARVCYERARSDFSTPAFDTYFETAPNSARLSLVSAYRRWVGAFGALFTANGGDWQRFFAAAEALGNLPAEERTRELEALEQQIQAAGDKEHANDIHCETLLHHAGNGNFARGENDDVRRGGDR